MGVVAAADAVVVVAIAVVDVSIILLSPQDFGGDLNEYPGTW